MSAARRGITRVHPPDCWCHHAREVDRQRYLLDLRPLNQQQEFLIRALTYGLQVQLISSADVRALDRDHVVVDAATLAYQSGSLGAYEAATTWNATATSWEQPAFV